MSDVDINSGLCSRRDGAVLLALFETVGKPSNAPVLCGQARRRFTTSPTIFTMLFLASIHHARNRGPQWPPPGTPLRSTGGRIDVDRPEAAVLMFASPDE